jgi:hypothetical protein
MENSETSSNAVIKLLQEIVLIAREIEERIDARLRAEDL